MADSSRLATGQHFLDGSFSPRGVATPEGSMVVACLRLEVLSGTGSPFFFVGKFSMIQARRVSPAAARVAFRCESDLSMERCLVALFTTRGEGLAGRESQFGFNMVRQRGGDSVASTAM